MEPTKNDLSESTRKKVTEMLQSRLAASIDLMQQSKQAHWNVKGPSFIALHELFDQVHEKIEEGVDSIAERIVQLGGTAEGTCKAVVDNTTLPEYSLSMKQEEEHVEALSSALSAYGELIRDGIEEADNAKDAGTADMLTQISREVDKYLWFVESHKPRPRSSMKSTRMMPQRETAPHTPLV